MTAAYPKVFLKEGREKSLRQRHPWIFSGAVGRVEGTAADGGTVDLCTASGAFLARACWNDASQIVARVWTWRDEPVDRTFFARRIAESAARRSGISRGADGRPPTNAFRVVNGEADLLPGLVVDFYAGFLSVQVLTLAMSRRLPEIVEILAEQFQPAGIWQRSDVEIRRKEGLEPEKGLLWGVPPPELLEICENGVRLLVDLRAGQKTGFFLDQRDNRRLVSQFFAEAAAARPPGSPPPELLNAFSYSAGFGVYAAHAVAGCRVLNLDASPEALSLARANAALNGVPDGAWDYLEGNAFELLRKFRDQGRRFDAVVLDPPKFAQSKSQVEGACRGYKDLNLLAVKLLRPGGLLFTFSCSGGVSPELFQKVVAGAAADAGRDIQVLAHLGPGSDHPVALAFPEGEYLKGLALRCL